MIDSSSLEVAYPLATAGEIALINLESTRQQSWFGSGNHRNAQESLSASSNKSR